MTLTKYISKSVIGGWQTQRTADNTLLGPIFNSATDLWKWQAKNLNCYEPIETTWELRTYDVWGNAKDGYEVNDSYRSGETVIRCKVEVNNAGTPQEFLSAYPSDSQIRRALGLRRFKIETDGDDLHIYVNRAKDSYPCGELYCTSHDSLSPIRAKGEPKLITCPQCGNQIPYEWNARGMTRCVSCHLLFENPEVL